jgi:hypothetical protein
VATFNEDGMGHRPLPDAYEQGTWGSHAVAPHHDVMMEQGEHVSSAGSTVEHICPVRVLRL